MMYSRVDCKKHGFQKNVVCADCYIALKKELEEVQEQNRKLREGLGDTLGTYNTPEFFEYLKAEKIDISKECKSQGARSFLLMFIGFYKAWLKRLYPELMELLNSGGAG
jgi:hypothetical protein